MKFESVIRKISSWAAAVIIYLVALSLYLGAKGFALGPDNRPVLVKSAQAAVSRDMAAKNLIPTNLVLPQGRSLGKNSAPVTIYEFSSLGCSHCAVMTVNICWCSVLLRIWFWTQILRLRNK